MPPAPFSLLNHVWLPVRRASGTRARIRPAELTAGIDDDPIVAFDWSRPDLDGASREFVIGLLSTACFHAVGETWEDWWQEPPDAVALDACFGPFRHAFVLDGPGPRLLQELEELEGDNVPIVGLLIDAPNASTLALNKDLFNKRGRVSVVGRAAAAISLFALQTFAPQGGRGHRTSLRGGGPLTTLLLPGPEAADRQVSLWHQLWANVFWDEDWEDPTLRPERLFPWLAPTRRSEGGQITTPEDVHPAQAFWGMPRRIRLDFEGNAEAAPCDLTGEVDATTVRRFRMRPSGTNYDAWSRGHPLTPYRREKPGSPVWLPVKAQAGRLSYRDWIGLVIGDRSGVDASRVPAVAFTAAERRLLPLPPETRLGARLMAAGYAMDRQRPMVAVTFVESEMPVRIVAEQVRRDYEALVRQLVLGAREAQDILSGAVRTGLWDRAAPDASAGVRRLARERFWDETEAPFHDAVARLADGLETQADDEEAVRRILGDVRQEWHAGLRRTAIAIFDALVPLDQIEERSFERVEGGRSLPGGPIAARRNLMAAFSGYGKPGAAFYKELGLPPAEAAAGRRKRGKTA